MGVAISGAVENETVHEKFLIFVQLLEAKLPYYNEFRGLISQLKRPLIVYFE